MTPAEFKSWFEGFTEAFTGCPTKAQWARIKECVGEIDGKPITEYRFVDHYINRYWPYYTPPYTPPVVPYFGTNCTSIQGQNMPGVCSNNSTSFNGVVAMNALGRAEAASLT